MKSSATASGGPIGGATPGIIAAAALAVLCQAFGPLALPLAVTLLSILLAATRQHPLLRLIALVSLQNGLVLAACVTPERPLPALACFVLGLPFLAGLAPRRRYARVQHRLEPWFSVAQLLAATALLAISLWLPVRPLAIIFAPLIAACGVVEAWRMRDPSRLIPMQREATVCRYGFMLLAVIATQPIFAWLAIVAALTATRLPALRRRRDGLLLALCAAGLALFGLLATPGGLPAVSYTSLFVGYAAVAAAVPELAMVIVVLILQMTIDTRLPPVGSAVLTSVAVAGLLTCSLPLIGQNRWRIAGDWLPRHSEQRRHRQLLAHGCLVAVALGLDAPDARLAAAVLLILLFLVSLAAPQGDGSTAIARIVGHAGMPPLGAFPGLVLLLLAIGRHSPWLLLPVMASLLAMTVGMLAPSIVPFGRSGDRGGFAATSRSGIQPALPPGWRALLPNSFALIPLVLALLLGFFAPPGLVDWLRTATSGLALTAATP